MRSGFASDQAKPITDPRYLSLRSLRTRFRIRWRNRRKPSSVRRIDGASAVRSIITSAGGSATLGMAEGRNRTDLLEGEPHGSDVDAALAADGGASARRMRSSERMLMTSSAMPFDSSTDARSSNVPMTGTPSRRRRRFDGSSSMNPTGRSDRDRSSSSWRTSSDPPAPAP